MKIAENKVICPFCKQELTQDVRYFLHVEAHESTCPLAFRVWTKFDIDAVDKALEQCAQEAYERARDEATADCEANERAARSAWGNIHGKNVSAQTALEFLSSQAARIRAMQYRPAPAPTRAHADVLADEVDEVAAGLRHVD